MKHLSLLLSLTLAGSGALWGQQDNDEALGRLQAEIARLERELEGQIGRRDDGIAELKSVEESLASTRQRLRELADDIAAQSERQAAIGRDRDAARRNLEGQQDALASQIRMSYMMGQQEFVRMLLSQESPADFGRMLVYYDHLNRRRNEQIADVNAELVRLEKLEADAAEVAAELERLRTEEQASATQLESERDERERVVARLNDAIESSGSAIDQMREEETRLIEVIARLAEAMEGFSFSDDAPFSERRGELSWPVEGSLRARFGEPRDSAVGRVPWSGVLIEAEPGATVRAIYYGRVMHAQWQPSMGLLLIIEHGEGFYSLYGHNAALLREAGDWVSPGDAIAEVGDTGGQEGAGLYFAILRNDEFIDPAEWIR